MFVKKCQSQPLTDRPAGSLTEKHLIQSFKWLPMKDNTQEIGTFLCSLAPMHRARLEVMARFDRTERTPARIELLAYFTNNFTGHVSIWSAQLDKEVDFAQLTAVVLENLSPVFTRLGEDLCLTKTPPKTNPADAPVIYLY